VCGYSVILTLNGVKGKNPSDIGSNTSLNFFLTPFVALRLKSYVNENGLRLEAVMFLLLDA
jgi:hypothetical protein